MGFRFRPQEIDRSLFGTIFNECLIEEKLNYFQKKKKAVAKKYKMTIDRGEYIHIPLYVAYKHDFKYKKERWYQTNDFYYKEGSMLPTLNKRKKGFRTHCIEFRDYQDDAVEQLIEFLRNKGTCTASLPPGWGKTVIGGYLAYRCGLRTLITYPLEKVQDGWITTLSTYFPDFKVWIVGQGKCPEDVDFILCMDKRIKKIPKRILKTIGVFIADEIHMMCSLTRIEPFLSVTPKFAIMISATLEGKKNGFQQISYNIAGEHGVYEISTDPYDVYICQTGFSVEEEKGKQGVIISTLRTNISKSEAAQDMVCTILMNNCNYYKTICLRMVKASIPEFVHKVNQCGITCDSMYGTKGNYKNSQVLVGTQQKMGTGFDEANSCMDFYKNPVKSNLMIFEHTTPSWDIFEQSRGRVMRSPNPSIVLMVYDNKNCNKHVKDLMPWLKKTNASIHYVSPWEINLKKKERIYRRPYNDDYFYKCIDKEQYEEMEDFHILPKTDDEKNDEGYEIYKTKREAMEAFEGDFYRTLKLKKLNITKMRKKKVKHYYATNVIIDMNVEYCK